MGTTRWETVHVFISSTFNDMHAERDYLVKKVFPRLRDWCERRKLRLVDIDLRWGVTESDATHNRNVVQTCLNRIDECRPFFLCFLGQRYGWIPRREDIADETFAKFSGLTEAVADQRSVTDLEVLHAVARPFHDVKTRAERGWHPADHAFFYLRNDTYMEEIAQSSALLRRIYSDDVEPDPSLRKVLAGKQGELKKAISKTGRPVCSYEARWDPEGRTPELAIPLRCSSSVRENQQRWRDDWAKNAGIEVKGLDVREDPTAAERAERFNESLTRGRLGDFLCKGDVLGEVVYRDLQAAITKRFSHHHETEVGSDLQREIEQQEEFVSTAMEGFIERGGDFDELTRYVEGDSNHLFALVGAGGVGKSTQLAAWVDRRGRSRDGKKLLVRFIGVGERSTTAESLLRLLAEELSQAGKLKREVPDDPNEQTALLQNLESARGPDGVLPTDPAEKRALLEDARAAGKLDLEIPDDHWKLRAAFPDMLETCGLNGGAILVLDALDQLQSGLTDLDWLPRELPPRVKLIISYKLGEPSADQLRASHERDPRAQLVEVRSFDNLDDRRSLVRTWLARYLKELDENHLEVLVGADRADSSLRQAAGNPLFLKIVLSELRVFGAFGQLGERIESAYGTSPIAAFDAVLSRLERDPAYTAIDPAAAVPLIFGLLAHSRGGLPDASLADLLLRDRQLLPDHRAEAEETVQLFLRSVRPFLARREGRYDFFYQSFRDAARNRYTSDERNASPPIRSTEQWNRLLADHCDHWSELSGGARRYALAHRVSHQLQGEQPGSASAALSEFGYLHERLRVLGGNEVSDIRRELEGTTTVADGLSEEQQRLLMTWQRFFIEEGHILRHDAPGAQVALLQQAWAQASESPISHSAREWLDQTGSRDVWLRALNRQARMRKRQCLQTIDGLDEDGSVIAFAPSGDEVVTGSVNGSIQVWDLISGRCLRTMTHSSWVTSVAVTSDGRRIVAGSDDGKLTIWDFEIGSRIREIDAHHNRVASVALTPDDRHAITASGDSTLAVWDLETGERQQVLTGRFRGHRRSVTAVAVTADGRWVVSGGSDRKVKVWDLETGKCVRTWRHKKEVQSIAVTAEGLVIVGGWFEAAVWRLKRRRRLYSSRGSQVAATPDGRRVVQALWDLRPFAAEGERLEVRDLATGDCIGTLPGHPDNVTSIAAHPDGGRAATSSLDGTMKVWDLDAASDADAPAEQPSVMSLSVAGSEQNAVTVHSGKVKVWEVETGKCSQTLDEPELLSVYFAAIRQNGELLVTGAREEIHTWDLATGECRRTFLGHDEVMELGRGTLTRASRMATMLGRRDVSISWYDESTGKVYDGYQPTRTLERVRLLGVTPDGRRAVSSYWGNELKVWNLETGACLKTLSGSAKTIVDCFAMSSDGKLAVTGGSDRKVDVWDLERGMRRYSLSGHRHWVDAVALTPDDRLAVSGSYDHTLRVWDVGNGKCINSLSGHTRRVRTIAMTPNGIQIVSGSDDGTVRVWDLASGKCLRTILAHSGSTKTVSMVPDGRQVLSMGEDKTLKVWDLETGELVAMWTQESELTCAAVAGRRIVAGTKSGAVLILELVLPHTSS